jgi:mannose-6-phosphate isomerase
VQLKAIKCEGKLPLRVHPDDEIASQRYDSLGREKLWYISKAGQDARLFLGWKRAIDASELIDGIKTGALEAEANSITPKAGECYRIKPGTVHGATGSLEIVEVSQSSALDFCVYPWGQELGEEEFDPAFSVVDALDFIDYGQYKAPETKPTGRDGMKSLADLPQFTVRKMDLRDPLHITGGDHNSYAIYHCLYGKAVVKVDLLEYKLEAGQTLLVPAEVDDFILGPLAQTTSVLEIMTEYKPEMDSYINPDAEAKVPGEEDDE